MGQNFPSPLRYPGGKGALADFIKAILTKNNLLDGHYVELYAGGAAIAWELLFEEYVQQVHINDLNRALSAFWRSAVLTPDGLCQLIVDTPVTIAEWYRQQQVQKRPDDHSQLELGFSTFFLNRTNRSGILKGGIIGGKEQLGEWKIDARFNKADLVQRIQRIGRYADRVHIYERDAADFIRTILPILPNKTFVYLDPPYFNKGQKLYENHYAPDDHAEIAQLVRSIRQPWLVSYDNCSEIRKLYKRYQRITYSIKYSARERYSGSEVIFFKKSLAVPSVDDPAKFKLNPAQMPLF